MDLMKAWIVYNPSDRVVVKTLFAHEDEAKLFILEKKQIYGDRYRCCPLVDMIPFVLEKFIPWDTYLRSKI